MMSRLSHLAFLLAAIATPHPATAFEGPPKPLAGQFRLDGGRLVECQTHYNRNAIRAVARLDNGLIVATLSGVLDRFDSLSSSPTRERVDVRGLACLARGDGDSFFAGFDDGRVRRLDPETLELSEIAKLPGEVKWIGWSKAERAGEAGLAAAIWFDEVVEADGKRQEIRRGAIHDLASGKSFTLENRPSSFFVDREGRLWGGADRGEWGDEPKLAMVRGDAPDARLIVRDAIPWPGGALLATSKGFQTYDSATRRLAKIDLGAPAETVTAMARDGLGRLWLGGEDGLRLVDVESKKSERINPVPGLGDHQVDCLAADPARADGVVAVVNSETVVFIRVSP